MKKRDAKEVECPKCKHIFSTISDILVNCNRCGKKFKRDDNLVKIKKKNKSEEIEKQQ